jgi:anaerobic magnesium-protoporphyrin IX monomethyl ester cyclase
MKVLLVNAIKLERFLETRFPPVNLAYLAAVLRNNFPDINIKIIDRNVKSELDSFKPDVVGISSVTQNFNVATEYARMAKSAAAKVLIGGVHISLMPQSMTNNMDIGVIGEGEETIVDVFKNNFENLENIKGIAYWKGGDVKLTPPRELIENLDTIPYPARDLLDIEDHTLMFTSRGCPYRCIFCSSCKFWKTARFHSAEYVVNEIKLLKDKYHVKYIDIADDLFIADKKRLRDIVDLIKREKIDMKFGCDARANMVDDETMKLLKEMNVQKIVYGLESGNDRVLTYLKGIDGKPTVTVQQNYDAVKIANKYGILVNAGFVIGSPDETREEILDTLRLARTSGLNHFEPYVITPLPGTGIWEIAKKKGLVSDNMDWSKLDVMFGENYKDAIIISDKLSREELHELYNRFKKVQTRLRIKNGILHPIKNNLLGVGKKYISAKIRKALK